MVFPAKSIFKNRISKFTVLLWKLYNFTLTQPVLFIFICSLRFVPMFLFCIHDTFTTNCPSMTVYLKFFPEPNYFSMVIISEDILDWLHHLTSCIWDVNEKRHLLKTESHCISFWLRLLFFLSQSPKMGVMSQLHAKKLKVSTLPLTPVKTIFCGKMQLQ